MKKKLRDRVDEIFYRKPSRDEKAPSPLEAKEHDLLLRVDKLHSRELEVATREIEFEQEREAEMNRREAMDNLFDSKELELEMEKSTMDSFKVELEKDHKTFVVEETKILKEKEEKRRHKKIMLDMMSNKKNGVKARVDHKNKKYKPQGGEIKIFNDHGYLQNIQVLIYLINLKPYRRDKHYICLFN